MYSMYSCENAVINSLIQQGKSIEDVDSGINGEGQLILAMITSFAKASGDHAIYGLLLSPPLVG